MANAKKLKKGDAVQWESSQGTVKGTVVAKKTKPFEIHGTKLEASKDDPRFVVESKKTGARAGHKASALKKR
jgi:hypothetical protein